MYSTEQLIEFHDEVRVIKEHVWYEHKEPDLYPILIIRWRDMEPQSVDVARIGAMIETTRDLAIEKGIDSWVTKVEMSAPLVLWSCLAAARDGVHLPGIEDNPPKGHPIEAVWLAAEGYSLEGDQSMMDSHQRGDLKRDYETNPASKVLERLTTYQVETGPLGTAEWGRVTSSFHKDDGGRIVWHEHLVNTSENFKMPEDGEDKLLDIMIPHVTRERLA